MKTKRPFRGSGFKHNLGSVWPFYRIWIITVVLLAPILAISMMWGDVVPTWIHADIWSFLLARIPFILLAAVGLGIFTTNRVAGPAVLLRRAFEEVKDGNLDCRLNFRRNDKHLLLFETAFNEMMVALRQRAESPTGVEADSGF
jgi:methyl-accepting chemotaxis protein